MMPFAIKKVPGGKLVRVDIDIAAERITAARITGDFFLHPEYALIRMERAIKGTAIPIDESILREKLAKATEGATLVGFTTDDLAMLIQEVVTKRMPGEPS